MNEPSSDEERRRQQHRGNRGGGAAEEQSGEAVDGASEEPPDEARCPRVGQGFFSMVRRHWREPAFWRWWWTTRASRGVRVGAALVLLGLLLAGGVFAAARLTSANAGVREVVVTYVTTVRRTVTVKQRPKVVRKLVPVVRRVAGKSTTVTRTQTQTQTLPLTQVQTVYRTVPVSVPGKATTVHDTVVHQVTVTVQKPQVVIVKTVTEHDTVTVTVPAAAP